MAHDKIESIFLSVLEDIKDYLPDLTIVGGWLPYIYSNYLWNNFVNIPVTTADIDFGVDQDIAGNYPKTIFQTLTSLNYKEKHLQMDRLFPVVLYKNKIPIEFITYTDVDITKINNFVGREIHVNKIDKFDFLLKNRIQVNIKVKQTNKSYCINCPKPSAFYIIKPFFLLTDSITRNKQRTCITCILFYGMRRILTQLLKRFLNTEQSHISNVFIKTCLNISGEYQVRVAF